MSQLVIGLTGGIGSGKTAVSDLFASLGISIIDADVIARQVVEPDQPAFQQIVSQFGEQVKTPEGYLDRAALREKVFNDKDAQNWLNQLLHPLIRAQMQYQTQHAESDYCLLVVPLLVENGLNAMVDRVLVVDVEESVQLARAASRDNNSEAQIKRIMAAQASRNERLALADDVINNNASVDELMPQVKKLHAQYLARVKG